VFFQLKLVARSLRRLNDEFAAPRDKLLAPLIERLSRFDLGTLEYSLFGVACVRAVLEGLSELLREITEASSQVSDRLAMRHFAHVDDISQQTVSV
jgi:uncharacterized alpha-E superfamily protein